jgi:hypothetical protein
MKKKCVVKNCNEKIKSHGYCNTHYAQIKLNGKIKHLRTLPNEYKIIKNTVYLTVYDRFHNPLNKKVMIDLEDFHLIKDKRIIRNATKNGYERIKVSSVNGKIVMLHRFLLNPSKEQLVDHKDLNTYNNKKSNLRICNKSENNMNRPSTLGVWFHKKNKNWCAEIWVYRKKIGLGSYKTKKEALKIRRKAEKKYFKEFAPIRKGA